MGIVHIFIFGNGFPSPMGLVLYQFAIGFTKLKPHRPITVCISCGEVLEEQEEI